MGLPAQSVPVHSASAGFDDFVASRPDEEAWELIGGLFVMQAQPTIPHSVIASNVERLLNDGISTSGLDLIACREVMIDMSEAGIVGGGNYVPDVAVLDEADLLEGLSRTGNCLLAVEVVSPSDLRILTGTNRPKIDVKMEGYRNLPPCRAIITVDQSELLVEVARRTEQGWSVTRHDAPEDEIVLADFGLRCTVADIYSRTPALRNALGSDPKP
ncbi:hypothetical protein FP2506_01200 [Fulvimarina pelagi HTCC2506]|uniref:Putative restriction endonuclease domain-containing protein n=1 Tax=Fulvimarina pelagi HTCC2506 TaxID=314231 RepID=Q0G257_9HYPH|nr:Uma2 family endonuclease [Fulvimarina pelagi]EAU41341.1 hypothetical protein FP2506_01200 [Fulvimarina pelagi HTCC2506]